MWCAPTLEAGTGGERQRRRLREQRGWLLDVSTAPLYSALRKAETLIKVNSNVQKNHSGVFNRKVVNLNF